jgi:hypothetical protein
MKLIVLSGINPELIKKPGRRFPAFFIASYENYKVSNKCQAKQKQYFT